MFKLPTVIQSKSETTLVWPSKLLQVSSEMANAPNAAAEPMIPANGFGTCRKPMPLIKKPSRGSNGMRMSRFIYFSKCINLPFQFIQETNVNGAAVAVNHHDNGQTNGYFGGGNGHDEKYKYLTIGVGTIGRKSH